MDKRHSVSKHAVLHSQINRRRLGPTENINSGHNIAVVNAQNHRCGLGPTETCDSGAKVAVLN